MFKLLHLKLDLFLNYDKNRDYDKEMRQYIADHGGKDNLTPEQYAYVGSLEAARNAKIADLDATGTNKWGVTQTNEYTGWVSPDISKDIKQQISDYESKGVYNPDALNKVAASQTARQDKASSTVGMDQYVNDDFDDWVTNWLKKQQPAPAAASDASQYLGSSYEKISQNYTDPNALLGDAYQKIEQHTDPAEFLGPGYEKLVGMTDPDAFLGSNYAMLQQLAGELNDLERPSYYSRWDRIKNELADQALAYNYDDFLGSDTYDRLANRYRYNGDRAARDAIGQLATRTGGLASSYAGAVGQQQYNDYMSRLEEAAYQMYNNERANALQNANAAWGYADNDYNRYLDALSQYNTDRNFGYNALSDANAQENWARQMAYRALTDQIAQENFADQMAYGAIGDQASQENWSKQMAYNALQDLMSQENWAQQFARQLNNDEYGRAMDRASLLASIGDYSGYSGLGYSDDEVSRLEAAAREIQNTAGSGRSSGSSAGRSGSGSGSGTSYGSDNKWQPVEDWVSRYGDKTAENYIKEHYKDLGYSSQSAALAAWSNHLLEVDSGSYNSRVPGYMMNGDTIGSLSGLQSDREERISQLLQGNGGSGTPGTGSGKANDTILKRVQNLYEDNASDVKGYPLEQRIEMITDYLSSQKKRGIFNDATEEKLMDYLDQLKSRKLIDEATMKYIINSY